MTQSTGGKSKARHIAFDGLSLQPRFEYGAQAQVAAVTGSEDGTKLGTGYVRFTEASIPWTVKYDEVIVVIEGEVTVETDNGDLVLGPRDSVWLPKGTKLVYRSASALVFYAIYPSNWAEQQT